MKPIPYRKVVIVIALSVINGLNATTRMSSLFFVASIDRYNVDREKASFPYALRLVMEPLSGPFVGYLACKIGFRPVIVLGGLITSIAFAACFFAEDILMLSIIYGGIFGIGIAMARELIPSVINENFDKDIALINGLALLGSSIGGFLLPPLFDVIFDVYGLSGTFLIIGGLLLHSVPAGMLLWPPKSAENKIDAQNSKIICDDDAPAKRSSRQIQTSSLNPVTGTNEAGKVPIYCISTYQPANSESTNLDTGICIETVFKDNCSKNSENIFISKDADADLKYENNEKVYDDSSVVDLESSRGHMNIQSCFESPKASNVKETSEKNSQETKHRTHNLPITEQNPIKIEKESKRIKPTKGPPNCHKNNKKYSILEFLSLFWDPLYILVTTSQSLFRIAYTIFIIIVMDFARDNDVPRNQAIYLVMCIAASEIIGRVGLGWITDRGYMGIENFIALSFIMTAAALIVMCFWTEFAVMFSAIFVFGLVTGGVSIVLPRIVSKYFIGNKKTTAMTSRYFLFGPLSLTISPLIGFFRTGQGSYTGLMYLNVAILLLCGVSQLFLPIIARHGSDNKRTVENTGIHRPIERLI